MGDSWNPEIPGQQVRLISDPAKVGVTTGMVKRLGETVIVQVRFGPGDVVGKHYDILEPVLADESAADLARRGNYGNARDLRRLLTFQKIRGDLTSIFYSMESSNTDFYAHQFKPVLKFIESISGRILIADEVGLGKTIEAVYIWKELRARAHATRLLIVCPSMLREKWLRDLDQKFGIEARILKVGELCEELGRASDKLGTSSFAFIASLEGLRPPSGYDDLEDHSPRSRLARLLEESAGETDEGALLDLVVIDEAHYLRNQETANNRLGRLLRDASRHLVLLTATPIQVGSENLFQLMRLLDEDQFPTFASFEESLRHNRPYTSALSALWRNPPDYKAALASLREILEAADENEKDAAIVRIHERLATGDRLEDEDRIEYGKLLESRSFLSRFMTRSRKRSVLPSRVERSPQVVEIDFTETQLRIYNQVTAYIRDKSKGLNSISSFALIARQRQLASCFPAALKTWAENDILVDFLQESLGGECDDDQLATVAPSDAESGLDGLLKAWDSPDFEREDQKYLKLKEILEELFTREPDAKVVVFAFFRGTLRYLARRLEHDRIKSALLMGGMGAEKTATIDWFRDDPTVRILLSSEVGSEGIDLQFSHTLVNYDLPWNPMRVEQRIGRLDRLGQKAERISVVNFVISNSIEDEILYRLYQRIGIFRESIGEIEEILGELSRSLIKDLLDPSLSDEERRRNAEDAALAVNHQRSAMADLENNAVNFLGFSDYLLGEIEDSRLRERWITPEELSRFIEEFLASDYPGGRIKRLGRGEIDLEITLSDSARYDFSRYLENNRLVGKSRLGHARGPVFCRFDPKSQVDRKPAEEFLDAVHPLVRWIRETLSNRSAAFHPISACVLSSRGRDLLKGTWGYAVQLWGFKGLRVRQYLAFKAVRFEDGLELEQAKAESLIIAASREGTGWDGRFDPTDAGILELVARCEGNLDRAFGEKIADYDAENRSICFQQERTARKLADRKIKGLREQIDTYARTGRTRMIPAMEGRITAENSRLDGILRRIAERSRLDPEQRSVGSGVIAVH